MLRRLERIAQGPLGWFTVSERGAGGRWHMHILIETSSAVSSGRVEKAWTGGRADVVEYDPSKGAVQYLTKFVDDDEAEYDISPPRVGQTPHQDPRRPDARSTADVRSDDPGIGGCS